MNFNLDEDWLREQVEVVIDSEGAYGNSAASKGARVQVEFVSVNPTGPVHVGHARGAVLGSALASVLEAAGYDVQREYYVNDAGRQMELFYETAYVRYLQAWGRDAEVPEEGYQGEYMIDLAHQIRSDHDDEFLGMSRDGAVPPLARWAWRRWVASIRRVPSENRRVLR